MLLDKLSNFLGVIILRLQLDAPHRHSQLSAFNLFISARNNNRFTHVKN